MNKKAEIPKISMYILGIIIFGMITVGLFSMVGIVYNANSNLLNNSERQEYIALNNTFGGVLEDMAGQMESMNNDVNVNATTGSNWGLFGFIDSLFGSAWGTLRGIGTSLNFMNAIFLYMTGDSSPLGIPSWVYTGVISLILCIIVFGLFSILTKRDV